MDLGSGLHIACSPAEIKTLLFVGVGLEAVDEPPNCSPFYKVLVLKAWRAAKRAMCRVVQLVGTYLVRLWERYVVRS